MIFLTSTPDPAGCLVARWLCSSPRASHPAGSPADTRPDTGLGALAEVGFTTNVGEKKRTTLFRLKVASVLTGLGTDVIHDRS